MKVRCSRCAHVFMVRRSDLTSSAPQSVPLNAELERALRDAGLQATNLGPTIATSLPGFPQTGVPRCAWAARRWC